MRFLHTKTAGAGRALALCLLVFGVGAVGSGCAVLPQYSVSTTRMSEVVSVPVSEMSEQIMDSLQLSTTMVEIPEENLTNYFDIQPETVLDFSYYVSNSESKADELAIFEASSDDSVVHIKNSVSAHLLTKEDGFAKVSPNEHEKLKNAVISSNSNFVFVCVGDNPEKALLKFESFFDPEIPK